jgi:hypothetical protein
VVEAVEAYRPQTLETQELLVEAVAVVSVQTFLGKLLVVVGLLKPHLQSILVQLIL